MAHQRPPDRADREASTATGTTGAILTRKRLRRAGAEKIADMSPLPPPDDLTSLVMRSDFSDDAAWHLVMAAIDGCTPHRMTTYINDPGYAGTTVQALVEVDDAAKPGEKLTYLFLADATTMADHEHSLLAVDLYDEPGRTFRVPPRWYADVAANLTIANMDFAEFADATDESGTYRGFPGE
jgi:hypothetical protein